ncbi:hypothetical protein ACFY36_31530 [Actinoplanes sp. NPDC000266]
MARVFITGSADGLGRAAARTLLGEGHDVSNAVDPGWVPTRMGGPGADPHFQDRLLDALAELTGTPLLL